MYPVILELGPFTIYSFGLMMGISFIIANLLLIKEFKRKKLDPDLASNITLIALVAGVAGSKLLYLLEHFKEFTADPIDMAFSPGGLTFYGGFILATISTYVYARKKGIRFMQIADAAAPALLLAYGIARIGCHLAGDGDYGFPTTLPWGTDYSNGTFPPSAAFRNFPEIVAQYGVNGVVPDTVLCHPTPIYELIICSLMFFFMWKNRARWTTEGEMFYTYLVLAGVERFSVEFLRLNPRLFLGLSEAQIFAVILAIIGAIGLTSLKRAKKHTAP
jgi:phosphatidylglycerol:prolipoprotein diacylglycerol transferase